jgi:plasmid rolling circle replication initiator protein Rep
MIAANPKLRFVFLTLTVKNCDVTDLRTTLDSMNNGFKKLMKRTKVDKVVKGYLRRFEVTKSSDGTAHPHFHVILAVMPSYFSQNYINQREWSRLWQESLQIDYSPRVDIRAVKATAKCDDPHLSIVNEVTKTACYCSKDKDLLGDKEWFLEHTRQVARTKEIVLSGIFRDYITDKPIEEEDILNAVNEEEENELIVIKADIPFRYEIKTQKYAGNL